MRKGRGKKKERERRIRSFDGLSFDRRLLSLSLARAPLGTVPPTFFFLLFFFVFGFLPPALHAEKLLMLDFTYRKCSRGVFFFHWCPFKR
jgi:hypothetical protein